jgi:nucleotide-binding universal stress UspA family protein
MSEALRTILVGVATIGEPEPQLLAAIELAKASNATLHVVHAFEIPHTLHGYSTRRDLHDRFSDRYRAGVRDGLEERLAGLTKGCDVRYHARAGVACDVLCELAEKLPADLLVVGATRPGGLLRTLLGSSAEQVIRRARMPVLILREDLRRSPERVLITTDLSEDSGRVHDRGVEIIRQLLPDSFPEIRSLHVVWHDLAPPSPTSRSACEETADRDLSEFLARRPDAGLPASRCVRIGNPAREIAAEVSGWGADLLVLGTHGRTGSSRLLLGSVAEATLRQTRGNVLVLPGGHVRAANPAALDALAANDHPVETARS